jgi:hypothetical protein
MTTQVKIPEEFPKIIKDFVSDIQGTFPEYQPFIKKWWKESDSFQDHPPLEAEQLLRESQEKSVHFVFKFCLKKFPPRFFDILYQNNDIFKEDSDVDTEFLPYIHFKNLWECDISEKTKTTIWKYLQLILFSIVGTMENREAFGDSAKIFESINEDEFKGKLEETLEQMKGIFENNKTTNGDQPGQDNLPNANDIHEHINGMLGGKLGKLAKEIAEETANDLDIDMTDVKDAKGVFQNLFKNPGKLMGLVKNVGEKLDTRIKSGEIKESEMIKEASEMLQKMKGMPGMGDLQAMLGKMGMGGAKMNVPAMEAKLNEKLKMAKAKEQMKVNLETKKKAKEEAQIAEKMAALARENQPKISDEELFKAFDNATHTEAKKSSKKKKGKK